MTDFEVDKLIVVTSAKKVSKGHQLDQQLIQDGLALYQEQLSDVSGAGGGEERGGDSAVLACLQILSKACEV
jgi:hypothetical protein